MILLTVATLVLLSQADKGWEVAAKEDGVTVYSRERPGTPVREMKAVGLIDGPPEEVWRAVRDYPNYPTIMPYTQEAKVLKVEDGGKTTFFYSLLNLPLVDKRDYVIRLSDESDWKEGKGFLKVVWKAEAKGPAEREGVVRVKVNDGSWLLEPRENGTKTFTTYYIYTDPGGAIPKWVANRANGTAVPNVFMSIRKIVAQKLAAGQSKKP